MIIEIDTDRLHSDISEMQTNLQELCDARDQIYTCLEELKSMWQGPAQRSFYLQTQIDRIVLQELIRNLNDLIECMEYAKSEYDRCGEEVRDRIASIRLSRAR